MDIARRTKKSIESEEFEVMVLGPTYTDMVNPYPTAELTEKLRNVHKINAFLAEEREVLGIDFLDKVLRFAEQVSAIIVLVSCGGGVPVEIPFISLFHCDKTCFFIKSDDKIGGMIKERLDKPNVITEEYNDIEDLTKKAVKYLNEMKGYVLLKRNLSEKLRKSVS